MYTEETLCDFGKKYIGTPMKNIPRSYLTWFVDSIKKQKDRGAYTLQEKNIVTYVESLPILSFVSKTFDKNTSENEMTLFTKVALHECFTKMNMNLGIRDSKRKIKITIEEVE